jgi:hypothetical protein
LANNPDGKLESYHEIPQSKYLFLKNTAIHKRFFRYWTLFIWATVWIVTRIINFDLLLWEFHLINWWLFFPEGFVAFGSIAIWHWSRKSEKKKQQLLQKRRREALLNELAGGEQQK